MEKYFLLTFRVMKDLKKLNPKSIIVRMPNWLGDLVMATPILVDLKNHFPDAEITAMCQSNVAALLAPAGLVAASQGGGPPS